MTVTSKPPAEIQALIDAHINGFNIQDPISSSACSGRPR
jgi:hypothetical protein